MTSTKTFQQNSEYAKYDLDSDGCVSDHELAMATAIAESEDTKRKHLAQLRMARYTLVSMGLFTVAMFFVPLERVKALSDISNLFYLTGGGVVVAFFGVSSLAMKK